MEGNLTLRPVIRHNDIRISASTVKMKLAMKSGRVLLSTLCVAVSAFGQEYFVSTIAGGVPPATPAPALATSIGGILGMASDAAGNVYLSTDLACVFKVNPAGTLTRVAGICRHGYSGDGGPATKAQLSPRGLAVDPNGSLYIADNGVIRKVLPDGAIATVGGVASVRPEILATDAAGNVYITGFDRRIRRLSTDGTITTVAGTGFLDDLTRAPSPIIVPPHVTNSSTSPARSHRGREIQRAGPGHLPEGRFEAFLTTTVTSFRPQRQDASRKTAAPPYTPAHSRPNFPFPTRRCTPRPHAESQTHSACA